MASAKVGVIFYLRAIYCTALLVKTVKIKSERYKKKDFRKELAYGRKN